MVTQQKKRSPHHQELVDEKLAFVQIWDFLSLSYFNRLFTPRKHKYPFHQKDVEMFYFVCHFLAVLQRY